MVLMDNNLSVSQKFLVERLQYFSKNHQRLIDQKLLGSKLKRDVYFDLKKQLDDFNQDPTCGNKWFILGGFRGVGKTTVLLQLYQHLLKQGPQLANRAFFLSLDETYDQGLTMTDVISAIESQLDQKSIYEYPQPVYIFLDEVHFVPKWAIGAKTLYDNCPKVFLVCTGSSAIDLWINADVARRTKLINMQPLSLNELLIAGNLVDQTKQYTPQSKTKLNDLGSLATKKPIKDLGKKINQALFSSKNATEVHQNLTVLQPQVDKYYSSSSPTLQPETLIEAYLHNYLSMPYIASRITTKFKLEKADSGAIVNFCNPDNEGEIRIEIRNTINQVVLKDIDVLGKFNLETKMSYTSLLNLLANNQVNNLRSISKALKVNHQTLRAMLQVLIKAQIICRIPPLGASFSKISKPYKYLFSSPAIRQALSEVVIADDNQDQHRIGLLKGRLLEDAIYMTLHRLFVSQPLDKRVEYDASDGGADFIVMPPTGLLEEAVVIEVGYNKSSCRQVRHTLKKVGRYGLVVTNRQDVVVNAHQNAVYIPFRVFFLV